MPNNQPDEGHVGAVFNQPIASPYLEAICRNFVGNLAAQKRLHPKLPTLPLLG